MLLYERLSLLLRRWGKRRFPVVHIQFQQWDTCCLRWPFTKKLVVDPASIHLTSRSNIPAVSHPRLDANIAAPAITLTFDVEYRLDAGGHRLNERCGVDDRLGVEARQRVRMVRHGVIVGCVSRVARRGVPSTYRHRPNGM